MRTIADVLNYCNVTMLDDVLRGSWQGEPYEMTRRWVIWHMLEHDLHHGGEISLTLGMHRLKAPDIESRAPSVPTAYGRWRG